MPFRLGAMWIRTKGRAQPTMVSTAARVLGVVVSSTRASACIY